MKHLEQTRMGLTAAAVFARAGVLRPVTPGRAIQIAERFRRWGASPTTLVAVSSIRWPDRVAIVDDAGSVTYREIEERADALAVHLASRFGVGPGDAVAIMCRNHRGLVEAILASGRLGADVLLLNTELPAHQLGPTLERHAPAIVVHDEEFAGRLREADEDRPTLQVWAGDTPLTINPGKTTRSDLPKRVSEPGKLILLTSGTTGTPKGVPRQPHPAALVGVAASSVHRLGLRTGGTMMVCPPAFHGMGLITLLLALGSGNTVVLQRRFDALRTVETVQQHHVDCLVVVPAMLQRLTALPDLGPRLSSLRTVLSGASELSPVVAAEFMDVVGEVLYNGYGSSEVGIATLASPADLRQAPGTVGSPTMGTSVLILDEEGQPLDTGQVGHIHIKSAMTFDGYTGGGHKETRHGHLASGDLGHLDAAGRLFIDGRADDMIVSGGENVFPQPVENALLGYPDIVDAAVIGVPDADFGQRLRAYIVLDADSQSAYDEEAIREHLRARLTRYEQPRDIVTVAEIPRNATGKVLRKQLATFTGDSA